MNLLLRGRRDRSTGTKNETKTNATTTTTTTTNALASFLVPCTAAAPPRFAQRPTVEAAAAAKKQRPTWLVGHDLMAQSERAADVAVDELARLGGGRVLLLHVVPLVSLMGAMETRGIHVAAAEYAARLAAEARLRVEAERLRRRAALLLGAGGASVDVEYLARVGMPADIIALEAARAERVVVGSGERSWLARVLSGSVAERVVRLAPVPTLVSRVTAARAVAVERGTS